MGNIIGTFKMAIVRNLVFQFLLVTGVLTVAFYLFDKQWALATQEARVVRREFAATHPPVASNLIREWVRTIPTEADVEATYGTHLSQDDIRIYYARMLAKQGWATCPLGSSVDPGRTDDSYCKQHTTDELSISNDDYPATYEFDIEWNWP